MLLARRRGSGTATRTNLPPFQVHCGCASRLPRHPQKENPRMKPRSSFGQVFRTAIAVCVGSCTLFIATGCGGARAVNREWRKRSEADLVQRSSYDLSCTPDRIALIPMGQEMVKDGALSSIVAKGCGHEAIYAMVNGSYVRDGEIRSSDPAPTSSSPSPSPSPSP